jgi:hypothetical protein
MPEHMLLSIEVANAIRKSYCLSWLQWPHKRFKLDVISQESLAAARAPRKAMDQHSKS